MQNYPERELQRLHQERGQQMVARFNQAFVYPLNQYFEAAAAGGLDLRQPDQKRLLNQIQATQDGINDWLATNTTQAPSPQEQIRVLYAQLLTIPAGSGNKPVGLPHLLQSLGFVVEIVPDFFGNNLLWQKVLQKRWADLHERQQYTTSCRIEQADKVVTITVTTPPGQPNNFAGAVTTVSVDPFADWSDGQNSPTTTQRRLDFLTALAQGVET